jgi:hypothetical protein
VRVMAIVPLNVHAGSGGDVHLDGFGIVRHSTQVYMADLLNAGGAPLNRYATIF